MKTTKDKQIDFNKQMKYVIKLMEMAREQGKKQAKEDILKLIKPKVCFITRDGKTIKCDTLDKLRKQIEELK